jgi:hypothetical protein
MIHPHLLTNWNLSPAAPTSIFQELSMSSVMKPGLTAAVSLLFAAAHLAAQGNSADLQQKLTSEFSLTKTTADRSDIVTAGAVLVLHKDGLVMYNTPAQTPPLNTYKDGRLQQSSAGNYFRGLGGMLRHGSGDTSDLANIPQRKFVSGEKFWITAVNIQQDGVVLTVYSDPFNDVRYYGLLKFPFVKNSIPPTDQMVRTVEEVITVAPADDSNNQGGNGSGGSAPQNGAAPPPTNGAAAPAAPAAPTAAMAPIAPPPPPPDQPAAPPKTIKVGQSKDVVIATWGQPTKDIKLASKEILVYPDMKVTFVAGKVSDVQ